MFQTAVPKIGYLSPQNRELIYENIHPLCYIFFDRDVEVRNHFLNIRKSVDKLTKEFMGIQFVIANETENQDAVFRFRMHVDNYTEITAVCVNDKGQFFRFEEIEQTFSVEEFVSFIHRFLSNEIGPSIRSDSLEEEPSKTQVENIIGLSFENFLKNKDQDLVIAFYSQTDEQQYLFNSYFNLASMIGITDKSLKFGRINILNNDYPPMFDIFMDGSTIFYVPKNDKRNPIRFTGKNDDKEIKKFILTTQYELNQIQEDKKLNVNKKTKEENIEKDKIKKEEKTEL